MALGDIDHIIVVMLENRSFDHMLGYLSLPTAPGGPMPVRGLQAGAAWRDAHANVYRGQAYPPHRLDPKTQVLDDPHHSFDAVKVQVGTPPAGAGVAQMGGFVVDYNTTRKAKDPPRAEPGLPMGYYDQEAVPIFDFLARNFAVCDHWFAAVPCGTQPNRLIAMGGRTKVLNNAKFPIPDHRLIYDWLSDKAVRWCAYQSGGFLPFFALMTRYLAEIVPSLVLSDHGKRGKFRRYKRFREHWLSADPMPSVIFIEPAYSEGPGKNANDDHPPTGVARGQAFLADIYTTLIANPARWARTMMIITYDEHGGFFDHEPPIAMPPMTVGGQLIETTGVRVPALVVSPQVVSPARPPGSVFTGDLDHTSILQLLVDKFSPTEGYSVAVNERQLRLNRLLNILQPLQAAPHAPAIPQAILDSVNAAAKKAPVAAPNGASASDPPTAQGLYQAAAKAQSDHPELVTGAAWREVTDYLTANPPPAPAVPAEPAP
jgi:phospholipase C